MLRKGAGEMTQWLRANCFCKGPRFNSLHPHGNSKQSVTPVPGGWKLSSDFCGYQACMRCIAMRVGIFFKKEL